MAFGYEDELKAEIARLRDALDEQTGRAAWHYECLTKCEETVIQRDAEIARLRDVISRAASHWIHLNPGVAWEGDIADAMAAAVAEIARLRLTDAERDAVEVAARFMDKWGGAPNTIASDTLRGLLERLT